VFLGGTEKIRDDSNLSAMRYPIITGEDMFAAVTRAIETYGPDRVVDLSDEPIVGYRERFRIAGLVLARGISYVGADFEFRPPVFEPLSRRPSLAVIGTGKRVGKTAVSAYICRELKDRGFNPAVVAMGRGGPVEPEVIRGDRLKIDPDYLLAQAKAGRHAASDHFEDALMSRVPTVGCRRCGGGMAGQPFISNVREGALVANDLDVDLVIFEGSGAAMPPVAVDARVTVAGMNQPADYILGFLGPYRLLISDLVVLTNCEADLERATEVMVAGINKINPEAKVVKTVFRPSPLEDIAGKRVFFATTAPTEANKILKDYLEAQFGARVVGISHSLSNRPRLRRDMAEAADFEVLLTELKAAAVDVVTASGLELDKKVVYCDNVPVVLDGESLSNEIAALAERATVRFEGKTNGKETLAK
jgi:cyclic 2,3-diphosphoglycerate synthase